jgi:hypothetical protein
MNPVEEFETRHAALKAELNDEPFFGPFVVRNGRTGRVDGNLIHTGYSIEATTAERKMAAWILREDSWHFGERSFVVSKEQLGFPFFYFHSDYVRLVDLLESLVGLRTREIDCLQLVTDLAPVWSGVRASPLKRNALDCLLSDYGSQGFAVAPAKLQRSCAVMRIVWVYPQHRQAKSITHYLPVGSLKFPLKPDGSFDTGVMEGGHHHRFLWRLGLRIAREHGERASSMLTEVGQEELKALLAAKRNGGHPRTKERQRRIQFVAERAHLWDEPEKLALLIRESKLYPTDVGGTALLWRTKILIDLARRAAELKIPPATEGA